LLLDSEEMPNAESTAFVTAHRDYRTARDRFIALASSDLGLEKDVRHSD
jgi:hypothetical protein